MDGQLSRRDVIAAATAGAGLGFLSPWLAPAAVASPPRERWEEVRGLFGLESDNVHMAGLLLTSHPKPVREAIERYRRELDKNPVLAWREHHITGEDTARSAAAKFLGGRAQDFGLTDSTTMGLTLLYNGVKVRADQEILTTTHDHQATSQSIALRAAKTGTTIRRVPLFANSAKATVDEIVGNLTAAIKAQTRVVAVTWVHSSTGMRLPIPQMAEAVAMANEGRAEDDRAMLFVDCVHGFGVVPIDLAAFGADALSAGCHKWLFGPRGTGIVWARPEIQSSIVPTFPSFTVGLGWGTRMTPGGFHSFEHRWALAEAFEFHESLGKKDIQARIQGYATQLKVALAAMAHVRLHTPMSADLSAGLVCFDVDGMSPLQVVEALENRRIIASTTPYAKSYARLTPGILNTDADIEKVVQALGDLG